MARWRLTEPHYLKVPGTRWEYSEVDRITGKPKRTQFDVPLYLNPHEPSDWNVRHTPETGDVVVCNGNNCEPKDIRFEGDPTPGMLPLDDEAQKITDKFNWKPTQGLDDLSQNDSYSNRLITGLLEQMSDARTNAAQASNVLKVEGMSEMMMAMTKMMEQNQLLLSKLVSQPQAGRKFA